LQAQDGKPRGLSVKVRTIGGFKAGLGSYLELRLKKGSHEKKSFKGRKRSPREAKKKVSLMQVCPNPEDKNEEKQHCRASQKNAGSGRDRDARKEKVSGCFI